MSRSQQISLHRSDHAGFYNATEREVAFTIVVWRPLYKNVAFWHIFDVSRERHELEEVIRVCIRYHSLNRCFQSAEPKAECTHCHPHLKTSRVTRTCPVSAVWFLTPALSLQNVICYFISIWMHDDIIASVLCLYVLNIMYINCAVFIMILLSFNISSWNGSDLLHHNAEGKFHLFTFLHPWARWKRCFSNPPNPEG